MNKLVATVQQNGKEFKHYIDIPSRGLQSYDVVPSMIRRAYGRDAKMVKLGVEGSVSPNQWTPPPLPPGFQYEAIKTSKARFAFGRKFKPKDDDFDKKVDEDDVEVLENEEMWSSRVIDEEDEDEVHADTEE